MGNNQVDTKKQFQGITCIYSMNVLLCDLLLAIRCSNNPLNIYDVITFYVLMTSKHSVVMAIIIIILEKDVIFSAVNTNDCFITSVHLHRFFLEHFFASV